MRNLNELPETVYKTVYTLQANALTLREIALYGSNIVYAGKLKRNFWIDYIYLRFKTTYSFQNKIII